MADRLVLLAAISYIVKRLSTEALPPYASSIACSGPNPRQISGCTAIQ
jgi:hypothetical protein